MNGIKLETFLPYFGKISKQWGLGESVGKVWGYLLFNSEPISQENIEKYVGYSRGLISRSLKELKKLEAIEILRRGQTLYYSTQYSLINGFNKMIEIFIERDVKPLIEQFSKNLKDVKDVNVRKKVKKISEEFKKLRFGTLMFSKIMNSVDLMDVKSIERIANEYSVKL